MMTKSLSQAAQGTGPAVKALDALNLSAADLAKLPIDEKMAAIQDAIARFIPTAQQAAVASQIFGSRAGLIFTRIDSATLRQATQDVADFGVAVTESDAAQIHRSHRPGPHPDHRRGLQQAMGISPQGHPRVVEQCTL